MGVSDAIEAEREALVNLRSQADVVVDTSEYSIYQLNRFIDEVFDLDAGPESVTTRIMSFGFKHGIPLDADLVLDCRFLPNPHWVEELRPLTGQDEAVKDFLLNGQPMAETFLQKTEDLLTMLVPRLCAGGQVVSHHRLRLYRGPPTDRSSWPRMSTAASSRTKSSASAPSSSTGTSTNSPERLPYAR